MDVLKGEGSLLLSTQPNIQSCYFTVTSHKHTHAIQFILTAGKGIFKRYHRYGYVWFLHTKPSPLYGLHTPGFFPRCTQSILLRCCVWKLYGEGSLMLSYEGFNHIHYCPSELPLAKGMLEGGQSSSPDPTMYPVPALWRTNRWRVDLGIIRGTSVLPVSLSPINHITPRNLTRGWMMKSFWNIQRRDYS